MKSAIPYWVLSLTAVALLAANVAVRRIEPAANPRIGTQTQLNIASRAPTPTPVDPPLVKTSAARPSIPQSAVRPAFDWNVIETTDYKEYAANLRALGFPEELVQAIVIADLNKLYEPREASLRPNSVPFDAPSSQRQRKIQPEDLDRIRQLREVQIEKQAVIREILGIDIPRELITTPTSRNYLAYEYALSLLPPEKRDAAQIALENEWFLDDQLKHLDRRSYVEAYKRIRDERNAALEAILAPNEFQMFEMNSTPAGTELARRTLGMQPTDEEFRAMFEIAWDNWVETGGVYGIWRAEPVPPEQIVAADARMEARMQEFLGEDRYLDYKMAKTKSGQQLKNLADRYYVPRDVIGEAFQLQSEIDELSRAMSRSTQPGPPPEPAFLDQRLTELQRRMEQVLGRPIWEAWLDGEQHRPELNP